MLFVLTCLTHDVVFVEGSVGLLEALLKNQQTKTFHIKPNIMEMFLRTQDVETVKAMQKMEKAIYLHHIQ